jgi:hypothetical protein
MLHRDRQAGINIVNVANDHRVGDASMFGSFMTEKLIVVDLINAFDL